MEGRDGNTGLYKYSGKELDEESDLNWYYFGARYYDPAIGRFLTIDPHASSYSNLTPYNYVANNPLIFIDPDGKDITSKKEEDEKGNTTYTITYTATISNQSSVKMSDKQLQSIANIIKKQIEKSFTGKSKDGKTTWKTTADIVVGSTPRKNDNIFKIVDLKGNSVGKSQTPGDVQRIGSSLIKKGNDVQTARTGAHEFGHGAGLPHPTDSKSGRITRTDIGNLMQQSNYSKGTKINSAQIEKLHNIVNFWFGARKK